LGGRDCKPTKGEGDPFDHFEDVGASTRGGRGRRIPFFRLHKQKKKSVKGVDRVLRIGSGSGGEQIPDPGTLSLGIEKFLTPPTPPKAK